MRRPLARVAFPLFCVAVISAVGWWWAGPCFRSPEPSSPTHSTQALTYAGYVEEYRSTVKELPWPSGFAAPTQPRNTDASGAYEVGSGEGDAVDVYQCAWGRELLAHTEDRARAKVAVDRWNDVKTMPAWNRSLSDPNTRRVIEDAGEKARLGDTSGIAELVKANC